MAVQRKYPEELRQRPVRLVLEAQTGGLRQRGASVKIGGQLGIPADTLRGWVQRAEVDAGLRPGTTTDHASRLVELERENSELRRANAILKSATACLSRRSSTAP